MSFNCNSLVFCDIVIFFPYNCGQRMSFHCARQSHVIRFIFDDVTQWRWKHYRRICTF
jgi:hypothetical protein